MAHDSAPPTIPTCCAGHRHFDNMLAAGWPAPDALDALRHSYRDWILARFGDAIDLGCDLLEMEVAA